MVHCVLTVRTRLLCHNVSSPLGVPFSLPPGAGVQQQELHGPVEQHRAASGFREVTE